MEISQSIESIPEINYNEPEQIIPQHDGTIYKRTGYCCQCGQCCAGCPISALKWIIKDKRGICSDRKSGYYLSGCNVWPASPGNIKDYDRCTYKFELIS